MGLRVWFSEAWHFVWLRLVSLYEHVLFIVRDVCWIIWLGLPAGLVFAVVSWLLIDWVMPAMDGTHLNYNYIWHMAKSPLQQVKDVNSVDLEWAFSARLGAIALGAFVLVCLGTGGDIRHWNAGGARPALWPQLTRWTGAFLACVAVATLLMWHQAEIRALVAPLPHQLGDF